VTRCQRRASGHGLDDGALWVPDNTGDAWQCVSPHLPPTYAGRFVPEQIGSAHRVSSGIICEPFTDDAIICQALD